MIILIGQKSLNHYLGKMQLDLNQFAQSLGEARDYRMAAEEALTKEEQQKIWDKLEERRKRFAEQNRMLIEKLRND